jgi:hypothetical protein
MMTRALVFSLFLLGAGAARACLCRFGRCWTARSGRLLGCLLLFQNPLGSQVVLPIFALGSPLLLPKAMSQLLYLLFRGHGYLPHEELMRKDQVLSISSAAFEGHFLAGKGVPSSEPARCYGDGQQARKLCEWRGYPFDGTIVVSSYQGGSR